MKKDLKVEIYKDFIRARVELMTIPEVCSKYKMSKQAIYKTADLIFSGNDVDYSRAIMDTKWKYIYSPAYDVIKDLESPQKKALFSYILKEMVKDNFTIADIARYIKRGKSEDRKIIYKYLSV